MTGTNANSPRAWRRPGTRVGHIALWLSALAALCFLIASVLSVSHHEHPLVGWGVFVCLLDVPFLLILLRRYLNRRLLWKVSHRIILTCLLMGLAPVVLFGTLTAIAGYILAGQYSINSALAAVHEAQEQLRGETVSLASVLAGHGVSLSKKPLEVEQRTNPLEALNSLAVLQNGVWHSITLTTGRGTTPASPFDGRPKPAWMNSPFVGTVLFNGKLYLCYDERAAEDKGAAEVLGALELNHNLLNSMSSALGRMLVTSGFSLATGGVDSAEKEAQQAETQAEQADAQRDAERDRRQQVQEQARDAQQDAREAQRDAQQNAKEAQRDAQQSLRDAEGDVKQAQQAMKEDQKEGDLSPEDRQDLQQAENALRQAAERTHAGEKNASPSPVVLPAAPAVPGRVQAPPARVPVLRPPASARTQAAEHGDPQTGTAVTSSGTDETFPAISGGAVPASAHLFDPRVYFTAPLPVVAWADKASRPVMLVMISRPSVLYTHLFATSVDMGSFLRNALVVIALAFGLLELIALWMAVKLSLTITRSVAGLYTGTTEIDGGNLAYRVKPERQDQLGALATSFNTMAGSIQELLVQQREKERLLSEMAIAQEVQRNLFPHSPASLASLDLHAVCVPALSVSGDYFDFIFEASTTSRQGTTMCLALGDISGKGMSAALLMATLHSAVRAFSLGEEDITSPAHMLDLLNRHLYRSTTPEKYATLFLAFYRAETRRLTYANGGHLPPILLRADGSVERLDVGGSVVGLLDALTYSEAEIQLNEGDLLVAYSDGLTEPESEGNEFGEARLLALLQSQRAAELPVIVETVFSSLQQWIGEHEQPDDMTLLLARQM